MVQKTESIKIPTNSDPNEEENSHSSLPKSRTRKEEESLGVDAHSLTVSAANRYCTKRVRVLVTASLLALLAGHRHVDTLLPR